MVMLTEQDFKDLEQAATDGIKVYYRLTQSLTTDDCDPLESMLDRLNHSCNELVNRFTPVKDYFSLISNDRVHAGKATAATAHHLAYDLVYDLHMTVGYKLNPDDDKWKNGNPNTLRIENLPQYRDEVIEVIKVFADHMGISGVQQYELIDRLDSESVKAWERYQEKSNTVAPALPLKPNGLKQQDFNNACSSAQKCLTIYEILLRYKSDDERACSCVMQLDDAWRDAEAKFLRVKEFIPLGVVQSAGFSRESAHDLSISLAHALCLAIGRVTLPDWHPAYFDSRRLEQDRLTADLIRQEIEIDNGGFTQLEDKEKGELIIKLRIECRLGWREYQKQHAQQQPVTDEPAGSTEKNIQKRKRGGQTKDSQEDKDRRKQDRKLLEYYESSRKITQAEAGKKFEKNAKEAARIIRRAKSWRERHTHRA